MRILIILICIIQILIFQMLTSETFWVAVGSLVTAGTLVYIISKDRREQGKSIENIKRALYFELVANIEGLFTGEVERKPLFEVMSTVRRDFAKYINDQDMFAKLQALYSELAYYETFVEKVYLKQGWDGYLVTEKQLSTANKFLAFFGESTIPCVLAQLQAHKGTYIDPLRDKAIAIKDAKIEEWKAMLKDRIDRLFR